MQNLIVGHWSQSGSREFETWTSDIWTSRSHVLIPGTSGSNIKQPSERVEPGLTLKDQNSITDWVARIISGVDSYEDLCVTMHAMSMSGVDHNYPTLLIEALRNQLDTTSLVDSGEVKDTIKQIDALFISFHNAASEENPDWSHAYYPVRDIKKNMETSLLTSDANRKKIIDLEIFDSPSSKALGFTFLWVVGQFLQFIESNPNHAIAKNIRESFEKFLWKGEVEKEVDWKIQRVMDGWDYERLEAFLTTFPLSWKLREGQFSMKELWESWNLEYTLNQFSSQINFAKLSYISWVISDIYLTLAMYYLSENKDDILNRDGDRVLLNWDTIAGIYETKDFMTMEIDNLLVWLKNRFEFAASDSEVEMNWVFEVIERWDNSVKYSFYNSQENFDTIWTNEVWGHFWVIPMFMENGLVYKSGLLKDDEYIAETKAPSMMFTWDDVLLERGDDNIVLRNANNKGEVFANMKIVSYKGQKDKPEAWWIELPTDYNEYVTSWVPHGAWWFEELWQDILPDTPFGLDIDIRTTIVEAIGVRLAKSYFVNPKQENMESLSQAFPKLKDFSGLKWIFWKVTTEYMTPDFQEKIQWKEFNLRVTNARGWSRMLIVWVQVVVWDEVLSEHKYTFA